MTIALGFRAMDGLVLAADTLETTNDLLKGNAHKVFTMWSEDVPGIAAVTGAGDAGYIDAFSRDLAQLFTDNPQADAKEMRVIWQERLKQFYADHVIPFAEYPSDERPGFAMLIGVHRKGQAAILTSDYNVLRMPIEPNYASVGRGANFADQLMRRLQRPTAFDTPLTVRQAQILAAYVIFRTKESVETCGNYTTIITLTGDHDDASSPRSRAPSDFFGWENIIDLERTFRTQWKSRERDLLWQLLDEMARPST